jgi:hypothetical protein
MGGDRRPDTNAPQNLITVCGHATEPGLCHLLMESRRVSAEKGWVLLDREDPLEVPVASWRGPIWLRADGTWEPATNLGRGEEYPHERRPRYTENPFTGEMERIPF